MRLKVRLQLQDSRRLGHSAVQGWDLNTPLPQFQALHPLARLSPLHPRVVRRGAAAQEAIDTIPSVDSPLIFGISA